MNKLVSRRVKMAANIKTSSRTVPERLLVGAITMIVGMFLLYGVGLAQDSRMHNAAHDTRHSLGFPCH
jgi:cobalt transporter subunit CbtB